MEYTEYGLVQKKDSSMTKEKKKLENNDYKIEPGILSPFLLVLPTYSLKNKMIYVNKFKTHKWMVTSSSVIHMHIRQLLKNEKHIYVKDFLRITLINHTCLSNS